MSGHVTVYHLQTWHKFPWYYKRPCFLYFIKTKTLLDAKVLKSAEKCQCNGARNLNDTNYVEPLGVNECDSRSYTYFNLIVWKLLNMKFCVWDRWP